MHKTGKIISALLILSLMLCASACGSGGKKAEAPKETVKLPVQTEQTAKPEPTQTPEETEAPLPEPEPDAEAERAGIRPEFKEAMDSYEAFMDGYCEMMRKVSENPTDLSMLMQYTQMLSEAEKMEERFNAWDEDDMSDEELKYYLEVSLRIEQKLIGML